MAAPTSSRAQQSGLGRFGPSSSFCDTPPSSQKSSSTSSSTNEMSCGGSTANSDSSGSRLFPVTMSKSKSAHHLANNCSDVYAEVVDTLKPVQHHDTQNGYAYFKLQLQAPTTNIVFLFRRHCRKQPLSLWDPNVDQMPSSNSQHSFSGQASFTPTAEMGQQRSHSSGFSSGSGSSSGATPPPHTNGCSRSSGLAGLSSVTVHQEQDEEFEDSGNILDEPELENAPWFQAGMPRFARAHFCSFHPHH